MRIALNSVQQISSLDTKHTIWGLGCIEPQYAPLSLSETYFAYMDLLADSNE
jgi:hypothetical protein